MGRTLATYASDSNYSVVYKIIEGDDGVIYCTCVGWKMRKDCKHLKRFHMEAEVLTVKKPRRVVKRSIESVKRGDTIVAIRSFSPHMKAGHRYVVTGGLDMDNVFRVQCDIKMQGRKCTCSWSPAPSDFQIDDPISPEEAKNAMTLPSIDDVLGFMKRDK